MFGLGFWEIVAVTVLVLLLFGAKDLPVLARSVGKVLFMMRKASSELRQAVELDLDLEEEEPPRRKPAKLHPDQPPAGYADELPEPPAASEPVTEGSTAAADEEPLQASDDDPYALGDEDPYATESPAPAAAVGPARAGEHDGADAIFDAPPATTPPERRGKLSPRELRERIEQRRAAKADASDDTSQA